jgi:hypothetical protein
VCVYLLQELLMLLLKLRQEPQTTRTQTTRF